jgi:predicted transcriptional regulator
MAKKAKKAKKISKSKKAKRAPAKRAATVTVPIQSVVQFVKMLIDEGHVDDFESRAKKSKALVSLGNDSADFVRKFLARNSHLRAPMAKSIRDPCPGNPFEC